MADLSNDRAAIRDILRNATVIAVIGHSEKPHRTSYQIARYLRSVGYTVYPVNPTIKEADGIPSYPTLADLPEPVQIVNVFRRPVHLPEIVEQTIAAGFPTLWTQLGVTNDAAADRALAAGLNLIMNRCIKVEHGRLF